MDEKLRKKIESRKAKAVNVANRDARTARIKREERIDRAAVFVSLMKKVGNQDYSSEEAFEVLKYALRNYELLQILTSLLSDYSRKGIRDINDIVSIEDIKEANNRKIINEVHES